MRDEDPGTQLSDDKLRTIFAAAGLSIPSDREAEVFKLARWMKQQARRVAGPHPVDLEPAVIFSLADRR
jgi:hypothetical protein